MDNFRSPSRLFLIFAGVTLLGVAAYGYLQWDNALEATIEEPDREITDLIPGLPRSVSFALYNPARSTLRIVGLGGC